MRYYAYIIAYILLHYIIYLDPKYEKLKAPNKNIQHA